MTAVTNGGIVAALYALAKARSTLNHQERELLKAAAKKIASQDIELERLRRKLTEAAQEEIREE